MQYDVFNGDADGICSLIQLRRQMPLVSTRITGVKRDIALLESVNGIAGDSVTVLDISMLTNHLALSRLLDKGVSIDYIDHHASGVIPDHHLLTHTISEAPEMCTSLLVNARLRGAEVDWAITGSFGDNLHESAIKIAKKTMISESYVAYLKKLGTLVNYNAYGLNLEDLHYHPEILYRKLYEAESPKGFRDSEDFHALCQGYEADLAASAQVAPEIDLSNLAIFQLPSLPWARRVIGVFSNNLVRDYPNRAHAVLIENEGSYLVSVRAPLNNRIGAVTVCRQFETGGGREAAAGINKLPVDQFSQFVKAMVTQFK